MTNYGQLLTEITQDIRTAKITAAITTILGPIISIIPELIGVVAGAVGLTFTIILGIKQNKKLELENELLRKKINAKD